MPARIDLHTHSIGSLDGGLAMEDYKIALTSKKLDCVAITDHGEIKFAQQIQKELGELGKRIIVGEEIKTTDGEIIGLYLKSKILGGVSPQKTIKAIKKQGGLVYIPHPFESFRNGISEQGLLDIIKEVDIIETYNSRAPFSKNRKKAIEVAQKYDVKQAASSDAHGVVGWCNTYTVIAKEPIKDTILDLLTTASYNKKHVGLGILYPKLNRYIKRH